MQAQQRPSSSWFQQNAFLMTIGVGILLILGLIVYGNNAAQSSSPQSAMARQASTTPVAAVTPNPDILPNGSHPSELAHDDWTAGGTRLILNADGKTFLSSALGGLSGTWSAKDGILTTQTDGRQPESSRYELSNGGRILVLKQMDGRPGIVYMRQ